MNITKGSCNWIFELPQLGRDAQPIPMQSATCYVISLPLCHTWRGCKCDNIRIFNSQKLGPNLRQTDNRNFLSLLRLLLRLFFPLLATSSWGIGRWSRRGRRARYGLLSSSSLTAASVVCHYLNSFWQGTWNLLWSCLQTHVSRISVSGISLRGQGQAHHVCHVGSAELCMCVTLPWDTLQTAS